MSPQLYIKSNPSNHDSIKWRTSQSMCHLLHSLYICLSLRGSTAWSYTVMVCAYTLRKGQGVQIRIWFQCVDYTDVYDSCNQSEHFFVIVLVRVTKHSCVNVTPSQRNRECDLEVNIVAQPVCSDSQRMVFCTYIWVVYVVVGVHTYIRESIICMKIGTEVIS